MPVKYVTNSKKFRMRKKENLKERKKWNERERN